MPEYVRKEDIDLLKDKVENLSKSYLKIKEEFDLVKDKVENLSKSYLEIKEEVAEKEIFIQSGIIAPKDGVKVNLKNSREFKITFENPFTQSPQLLVTFGNLDMGYRAKIETIEINATDFTVKVSSLGTDVYFGSDGQTTLVWLAYGN